jgi:glycosyltransferase involved in cell wall biosynthesis
VALDVTAAAQGAGIGRYTRGLARTLFERAAHDYVAFTTDRSALERLPLLDSGVKVASTPLATRWMWILWHRLRLRWSVERWTGPLDAFHATDFLSPPLARAGSVVTVHDLSFLVHPETADPGLARYLAKRVPGAVSAASQVLADSRRTKRDLVERLGVPERKVTVAYPGLDAEFGHDTDSDRIEECRARYGLHGPFVLGVGTLEPRKNWPQVIAAFEAAAPNGLTLVIAGRPGWGAAEVDAAAWKSRAPVRLLGFVSDLDLEALYRNARFSIYWSQYEGFGYPPLEAMACGCPCLTSDGGSLPEVVGDAGLVVPVGDFTGLVGAVARLASDAELRRQLAGAGVEQAGRFQWDVTARVVEHVYLRARPGT